eukprot:TRINITY_DN659761_c0_g2_i1.p1 TRINITY_DN659761_c0_g2~~TRINITY_DN659761_c0_g2_i1.p1  ORF type:complete len:240 (-),score=27.61 TRINITY_DN659761_c0_g2_i1:404-1123(-)
MQKIVGDLERKLKRWKVPTIQFDLTEETGKILDKMQAFQTRLDKHLNSQENSREILLALVEKHKKEFQFIQNKHLDRKYGWNNTPFLLDFNSTLFSGEFDDEYGDVDKAQAHDEMVALVQKFKSKFGPVSNLSAYDFLLERVQLILRANFMLLRLSQEIIDTRERMRVLYLQKRYFRGKMTLQEYNESVPDHEYMFSLPQEEPCLKMSKIDCDEDDDDSMESACSSEFSDCEDDLEFGF